MRSLLWKEWHEQAWKLGFGCVVLGAMALIGTHSRILADKVMAMWVCSLGIGLLPILSATGFVPAERSEGSLESLLSLPVRPRQILLAKLIVGALLCAAPLIVAALASLLLAGDREVTTSEMLSLFARSTLTALSLFIWMMALTIRLPSEARAAMLSVGILILWIMITGTLALEEKYIPTFAWAISPMAPVFHDFYDREGSDVIAPVMHALVGLALFTWSVRQVQNVEEE